MPPGQADDNIRALHIRAAQKWLQGPQPHIAQCWPLRATQHIAYGKKEATPRWTFDICKPI